MGVVMKVFYAFKSLAGSRWRPVAFGSPLNKAMLLFLPVAAVVTDHAHGQAVARRVVDDFGHVVADEEQSTATGPFQVLRGHGVGDIFRIEARAFVDDANIEALGLDAIAYPDRFVSVHLIAMLDGIDQGLFQSQLDRKHLALI